MGNQERYSINKFLFVLVFVISLFWIYSIIGEFQSAEQRHIDLAVETAESYTEAVRDIREWATRKGGVYVPTSEDNQPNPYLESSQRVLRAEGDLLLTNLNPAYVTRQVSEITNENTGIQFSVVSSKPVNPLNTTDHWEETALNEFDSSVQKEKVYGIFKTADRSTFRYITPIYLEEGCQSCHAEQDHIVGELRGGISVSLPYEAFEKSRTEQIYRSVIIYTTFYVLLIVFVIYFGRKLIKTEQEKEMLFRKTEVVAHTDNLTGLANRHYFFGVLDREIERYSKECIDLALIVIDMNGFKHINDKYGHLMGDKVLVEASQRILNNIRATDLCGRLGGDEFIVMLPETALGKAIEIGEQLRQTFGHTSINDDGNGERIAIRIHASIGVANLDSNTNWNTQSDEELRDVLVAKADKAMYMAKEKANDQGGSHVSISI